MQLHLRKRYKHFSRYREIANVLVRHGFGYLAQQFGLAEFTGPRREHAGSREQPSLSPAERVRLVLEELGPTFIKLGQVLSTRADLLAPEYIRELEKLQDRVPPFPFAQVRERIQMELGQPLEEIFTSFDPVPLAAASIGQVHRATLAGGQEVAVKVERPGTEKTLSTDIEILYDVARLVDRHGPWREFYRWEEMVEEFERTVREEIDFVREGRHADTFRHQFAGDPTVYFPAVHWDYTTSKVLTLEYVEGVKLNALAEPAGQGIDRRLVARRLTDALLKQILLHGFFHGDPHPGNLAALSGDRVLFMDFGIVGRLDENLQEQIGNLVLGLVRRSTPQVLRAVESLGVLPPHVDREMLHRDIDALREKYYEVPLGEISLAESMSDVMTVAFRHRIRVPAQFTLLVKTLVTLDGVAVQLDPGLSIIELARPFGRRLLARRFSPEGLQRLIVEHLEDYHHLFTHLPRRLDRVLDQAGRGEIRIKTVNPEMSRIAGRLNAMVNRLVLGILLGSLIVGSSLLVGRGYTVFWGLPLAEAGFTAGGFTALALIISILRSRRF
ncbi:ABC1 kinase family protein [Desulfotomaculum copahuensis]|uniref:ABC transporter n=1 Tax=Desulfotomaculum copahuensis TaxID=1838280 RepID=A0A1B7LCE1_9FIRM|nr:AarF/ABC1/UbiB kinase family protein [Desulfotomaculum copahuensis]OAT80366.1 ABC transporter [Desulfotomaculum copahuensis]